MEGHPDRAGNDEEPRGRTPTGKARWPLPATGPRPDRIRTASRRDLSW